MDITLILSAWIPGPKKHINSINPSPTTDLEDANANFSHPYADNQERRRKEKHMWKLGPHSQRDETGKSKTRCPTWFEDDWNNGITTLDKTITGLVTRVTETEDCISATEDTLVGLNKIVLHLRKQNDYLLEEVDQLENYSRGNNIWIKNHPEGCEGMTRWRFSLAAFPLPPIPMTTTRWSTEIPLNTTAHQFSYSLMWALMSLNTKKNLTGWRKSWQQGRYLWHYSI